jgi:hypothetical protein
MCFGAAIFIVDTTNGAWIVMQPSNHNIAALREAIADALAFGDGLDETALAALPETDRRTYWALKGALAEVKGCFESYGAGSRLRFG